MQQKTCTRCKITKDVVEFTPQKRGKYGVTSNCRICVNAYRRKLRDTDEYRAKHAAQETAWRKANPERYRARVEANRENIRESSKQCGRRWRAAEPERHIYYKVKQRAKSKNIPFDLELSDIVIPEKCPVLGITLMTGKGASPFGDNTASLDKIIPSKGYVKGNVRVISFRANRIKCDATLEEIRAIERYLAAALQQESYSSAQESNHTEQETEG